MNYAELIQHILKGHKGAIAFFDLLMRIAHVWDDVIDGDRPVKRQDITTAFEGLFSLNANAFYRECFDMLHPIITMAVIEWQAANKLEATNDLLDKQIAFITRSSYLQILIMCALLVGGKAWAIEVTPMIRRHFHGEGFDRYLLNLRDEKIARRLRHKKEVSSETTN